MVRGWDSNPDGPKNLGTVDGATLGRAWRLSRGCPRGIGGVIPQPSDKIPPDAPRLFEDVKLLVDSAEQASGTWMRQIELENPPPR